MLAALHPFSNRPHLLKYVEEMTGLNEILRRSLIIFLSIQLSLFVVKNDNYTVVFMYSQ